MLHEGGRTLKLMSVVARYTYADRVKSGIYANPQLRATPEVRAALIDRAVRRATSPR